MLTIIYLSIWLSMGCSFVLWPFNDFLVHKLEQRDKGTTSQTAVKTKKTSYLAEDRLEAIVPHFSCELLDLDTHPTELATEAQGDKIEFSILLVVALPVLGIGPGGPEEGQAPHQEVGKVGEGVEHQKGRDLIRIKFQLLMTEDCVLKFTCEKI